MSDRALYVKTVRGFEPANDMAMEFWRAGKVGELVDLEGKRPRNAQFHRLWWAMLSDMAEHSNPKMTAEELNFMAKVATQTGSWVKNPKTGVPLFMPGSISFAAMDQIAFKRFTRTAAEALCERFLPGLVPGHFLREFEGLAV